MKHAAKKFGWLILSCLLALGAVFSVIQFAQAMAAPVEAAQVKPGPAAAPHFDTNLPAKGYWIIANNAISSNFFLINDATGDPWGPFLQDELGSAGGQRLDVAVTPDGLTALISNFGDSAVYIVDLSDPLAPSFVTSVTIPLFAEDIDISPDGQFALVTNGGFTPLIATIDIEAGALVYTTQLTATQFATSVDIGTDGTVLVSNYMMRNIHTLVMAGDGSLTFANTYTPTFEGHVPTDTFGVARPVNAYIAPDGQTVLVPSYQTTTMVIYQIQSPGILSFTQWITGAEGNFTLDEFQHYPGIQSIAFNEAGDQAYLSINGFIYTNTYYMDRLAVLNIDGPGHVSLEPGAVVTIPHTTNSMLFGVDTLAVAGNRVYVSYPTVSGPDNPRNVAIVDLTDMSVTTTLVMSAEFNVPTGLAVLPLRIDMQKSVSDETVVPGQMVTYTLVLTSAGPQVTNITIRDPFTTGLEFVGPVMIFPPSAGTPMTTTPELVTDLVIPPYETVTIVFPVQVGADADAMLLTNTAFLESPYLTQAGVAQKSIWAEFIKIFMPEVFGDY